MALAPALVADQEYRPARDRAAARHNAALRQHGGHPRSSGAGIVVTCDCGQAFTLDGWHKHIIGICLDTPTS